MAFLYELSFPNNKKYIGITSCHIERRLCLHRHHAKKGRPGAVQAAIRKYGDFKCRVLLEGSWEYVLELETRAILSFNTKVPRGYNLTDGGEGSVGYKATDEQRARQSVRMKASPHKIKPSTGYRHTQASKIKMALSHTGEVFSKERKERIGKSKVGNTYNVGRACSEETRKKISAAQKGRPRFSDEQKSTMSAMRRGKPWTPARRAAQREKYANAIT